MRKLLVPLLLTLSASVARADSIEFDMPGLTGNSTDMIVTDSFVYTGPAAAVNAVSIHVVGNVIDLGEICCGGPAYCPGPTYDWFMNWYAHIKRPADAGRWTADHPGLLDQVMAFDQTGLGETQNGFASLSNGDEVDVSLYFGRGAWLGECDLIQTPTGTLTSVTVILDVTYPLSVDVSTWGKIKALYR
jgi:hypothetical protein